jgi:manganese/zinc/iron transport system permease protein
VVNWLQALPPDQLTAFWTILVAVVCSVMCALLGVWLVLQRVSMLGDAISHSVLPGLVLVFLVFQTRASLPMLIGAAVAGLLTVVLTRVISRAALLKEDASMGVVFTALFAFGVLLISRYARQIDLDPGCVLYGLIEFVAIDTFSFGGLEVPRALITMVPALLVSAVFLLLFRKELALLAFDPALARALGKRPEGLYYALMAMVAVATVASFEAVGSILVIAMLIGPAAAAQLLTRKLRVIFTLSVLIAVVSSVAGYYLAVAWNTSIAGMMAVVTGAAYAGALVLSPSSGLLYRLWDRRRRLRTIQDEDVLAAVYRLRESGSPAALEPMRHLIGAPWFNPAAISRLIRTGRLRASGDQFELTPSGDASAAELIRRHRLLETYLVDEMRKEAGEVHEQAHRAEHYLGETGAEAVADALGDRKKDPHGKDIPRQS